MKNHLGQRGEALFNVILTRFHGRPQPIFRPQFLGDKWPIVDFIVELVGVGSTTPYFFVQVRSTRQGYTHREKRLKVQVSAGEMRKLVSYPAPTYIVGIDENQEFGYIISANGERLSGLSSLSTNFPLNKETQEQLWQEVRDFWEALTVRPMVSKFIDPKWR
jgi:hypothetical protein